MIHAAHAVALAFAVLSATPAEPSDATKRSTKVAIEGAKFLINDRPTYEGRSWRGHSVEGLLMNSRMVQGIFDDRNPDTRSRWAYPDTGTWDAERNTNEFLAAMPEWRRHGLLAFTINLQGGSPEGYSKAQAWLTSAIDRDGSLRADQMARLERILDRADELGMVVILGLFYFGQDQHVADEAAVVQAVDNSIDWVIEHGYTNVIIEVNNECDVKAYDHDILKPDRVHELILRVKERATAANHPLPTGSSYGGGSVPRENVVRASDFLLMHGNGVTKPGRIAAMVRQARAVPGYKPMPILFNEDDHFDFDKPDFNMKAAISEFASWGYFDPGDLGPDGKRQHNYIDGYQSPPVNWGINTDRKRAFFAVMKEVAGAR